MRTYYETLSKETLIDQLLHTKGKLKIKELEATWLDELADSLRDGEEGPEMPSKEFKETKERYNKHIISESFKIT